MQVKFLYYFTKNCSSLNTIKDTFQNSRIFFCQKSSRKKPSCCLFLLYICMLMIPGSKEGIIEAAAIHKSNHKSRS